MRVRSQAKRLTIAALPTDLLVTGTLRDPVVQREIVELGIMDDTRCDDTLRRAQGGRRGG